jgi:hypothetical protein
MAEVDRTLFHGLSIWSEAPEGELTFDPVGEQWSIDLAWHAWRLASCVEFNGGHDVRLQFYYGDWSIVCAHGCPLELHDFYPDGSDVVFADLPIKVEVETVHHPATPDHGDEWDVTVGLEPR